VLRADLLRAIHAAARGEPTLHPEAQRQLMQQVVTPPQPNLLATLTDREMDVLRLITQGHSNKEIASTLHLTEGTVKGYVSTILGKLQVTDRTQAALYAVRHGVE
jgi:NarL family two-component system response regulator LiaR